MSDYLLPDFWFNWTTECWLQSRQIVFALEATHRPLGAWHNLWSHFMVSFSH